MSKSIKNETDLRPIVNEAVKALYGQEMQNVKILKANRLPLFKEPKQSWLVDIEFNDDRYEYTIQIDVHVADGRLTRSIEMYRSPLQK